MDKITKMWKEVQPVKYVITLICVFLIDSIIMQFLWHFGYMDWLWKCFVDLFTGNTFILFGSNTLYHKGFLITVLKAFAGLVSGTGILVVMWDIIPSMVMDVLGVKIEFQKQAHDNIDSNKEQK